MGKPWEKWIPGVLNKTQIIQLCDNGLIKGLSSSAIGESSFDLCLSNEGYVMPEGSVKPYGHSYKFFVNKHKLASPLSRKDIYELTARNTYVFKLRESFGRPLADAGIYGQATAKSSVGRVDVLTRLIVDGMNTYEGFTPDALTTGDGNMYLEITPMTFNVKVKEGIPLSQLRLFYGDPDTAEIKGKEVCSTVFCGISKDDGSLSVDLSNDRIGGLDAAAFYAEPGSALDPVPLWKQKEADKPRPEKYWRLLTTTDNKKRIKIEKTRFYLLRSKEKISVPPGIAVYCRASDETIGEMRIHYAGFAHPWFGWEQKAGHRGTPLIFEVRGHDVDVSLADGERMANLQFFRMSEDCEQPEEVSYEDQTLQLSNFFGEWPEKLKLLEKGRVEPKEGNDNEDVIPTTRKLSNC